MKRKIVAVGLVILLIAAVGAFAKETKPSKQFPWMADFNQAGQINLYGSVGWYGLGFDVSAGPEFIIQGFNLGGIPLEWGVAVRGLVGFASYFGYSGFAWGVAPMASLHWGMDFGGPWKFDWYVGAGLGISGASYEYLGFIGNGPYFSFASFDGVAWHFTNNLALILDYAYVGIASVYGIGLEWSL